MTAEYWAFSEGFEHASPGRFGTICRVDRINGRGPKKPKGLKNFQGLPTKPMRSHKHAQSFTETSSPAALFHLPTLLGAKCIWA